MYYRILVMKIEDNPAFDVKAADEWEERQRRGYGNYGDAPVLTREVGTRQLDVVLTEKEFQAIKQAIIQGWT